MVKKGLMVASALAISACMGISERPRAQSGGDVRIFGTKPKPVGSCDTPTCGIDLTVTVDANGACLPKPSAQDELVVISSPDSTNRKPVQVYWQIKTPGYSFEAGDGITFKNGQSEFQLVGADISKKKFRADDLMTDKNQVYRYKIQVTEDRSGRKCVYDPGIINEWP